MSAFLTSLANLQNVDVMFCVIKSFVANVQIVERNLGSGLSLIPVALKENE